MAVPEFTMRQLLEAGVHFGHQTHRWNPKMKNYIYGSRNSIHIIDLAQTVPLLHQALLAVTETVAKGGRVLFVGTKRAASEQIAEAARRSAQYYVNSRWLGGTLTNYKTISNSIKHLRTIDETLGKETSGLTKREMLSLTPDEKALDYLDTQTFRRTFEARLPAAASTFKELKHLLPNHWLNLNTGKSTRFWPSAPLESLTPETAIDRVCTLMSGQILAAAARFDLALSLTAGFDSRLMLATAREVADRLCIMTLRQGRMPDHFPDIEIPARLLKLLGLPHEVVYATSTMRRPRGYSIASVLIL